LLHCAEGLPAQPLARATNHAFQPGQSLARERDVASRFAPVFYQALGDKPRYDYITNFDFDRDWRGDNNWDHATDSRFPLKSLSEKSRIAENGESKTIRRNRKTR